MSLCPRQGAGIAVVLVDLNYIALLAYKGPRLGVSKYRLGLFLLFASGQSAVRAWDTEASGSFQSNTLHLTCAAVLFAVSKSRFLLRTILQLTAATRVMSLKVKSWQCAASLHIRYKPFLVEAPESQSNVLVSPRTYMYH